MKKVCVLMSTYNGEKYIVQQIESILSQKNIEKKILIRDDGSTDNTIDILKNYQKKGLISYYNGENIKPAKSFMDLIMKAEKCDYYAFSDQDDFWMENKLDEAVKKLEKIEGPALYFCNAELVDANLENFGKKVYKKQPETDIYTIMCAANVLGCTVVFNKELANIIKQREVPNVITMHDAYISRICVAIGGKIIFDNKCYIKYRQHENNVIGIKTNKITKLKQCLKYIFIKSDITIDEQANEIMRLYEDIIPQDNKKALKKISEYRKNLFNRVSLATSKKTKYISKKMSLKLRMTILFGNR